LYIPVVRLSRLTYTVTILLITSIATATIIRVPQDQPIYVNQGSEDLVLHRNSLDIEPVSSHQRDFHSEIRRSKSRFKLYEKNWRLIENIHQDWIENDWVNSYRYTYTYDENQNVTEYLRQNWTDNDWLNSSKETHIYDANSNMTEYLHQVWNGDEWVDYYRYTYTYDENNNMIESLRQDWSENEWQNIQKVVYYYDENNNKIEHIVQYLSNNEWVNYYRGQVQNCL